MKLTKTKLKQIIKEELQEEIELQELYFPFFGGKLPEEEVVIRRKQLQAIVDAADELDEEAEARFREYYSGNLASEEEADSSFLGNQIEAGRLGQQLQVLRKLMRTRHKKHEAQTAMNIFDHTADHISSTLGGIPAEIAADKAAESKRKKQVARDKAEREAREEEEQRARAEFERERSASRRDRDDPTGTRFGSSRGSSHRVNPGFAGSGNMGYGESIDKSELETIIREEINKILNKE